MGNTSSNGNRPNSSKIIKKKTSSGSSMGNMNNGSNG
jgi:hypothetical protein